MQQLLLKLTSSSAGITAGSCDSLSDLGRRIHVQQGIFTYHTSSSVKDGNIDRTQACFCKTNCLLNLFMAAVRLRSSLVLTSSKFAAAELVKL